MKKVTIILLIAILASTLLMAAAPLRLVRLTVINKSGHTIYMKLEGLKSEQFYYLTIPKGTKSSPNESTYTLVQDVYDRTTWYGPGDGDCEGWKTTGELFMTKHIKINFIPCGYRPAAKWVPIPWLPGFFKLSYNYGEPGWGEKVGYFKWTQADGNGCFAILSSKSFKSPRGCWYHYQY